MRDIRTITLDLDDTLWAIRPVIERAEAGLYDWLREYHPRITESFSRADISKMREDVVVEVPEKSHDFTFLRRKVLARVGDAAGYGHTFVDSAMTVFNALRNDVELFPEVRPALNALRQNYCIIAVTNGNANLDMIGIRDLFHEVVSAASAGTAKPAREIFDVAVQVGGAQAEQTLHVGDHPEVDVVGANNAGLKSAWVNRDGIDWPDHLQRPDAIVKDVGQLLSLLGLKSP
jgi:putative hydrolase of the HAD superfamily